MEETNNNSAQANVPKEWDDATAFEAWKHFANIGGADKDRMIQIATWLLGFSAGIVALTFSETVKSNKFEEPLVAIFLSIVGIIIASIAFIITLLYGGYANWNWAKADQIANEQGWIRLDPDDLPPEMEEATKKSSFVGKALRHSRSKKPYKELAPVFYCFLFVSFLSFGVHVFILIWSIINISVNK